MPRSRSVVTLVTARAVMASRLATTMGTTAMATAARSGRGDRACATTAATAATNRRSQATRTTIIARPWARVWSSRQSTGLLQTGRDACRAVAEPASPSVRGRRCTTVFQARARAIAHPVATAMMPARCKVRKDFRTNSAESMTPSRVASG